MTRFVIGCSFVATLLLTAGCGPVSTFTVRDNACPARPEGCEVTVITSRPEREYVVMGVLDLEAFNTQRLPRDEETFRALVRPAVCEAGGDGVIPGITGDGRYIQATVVKWVEPGATGPACLPPEPDAGVPDASADDEEEAEGDAPVEEESPAEEPPAEDDAPAPESAEEEAPADEADSAEASPVSAFAPYSLADQSRGEPC